MEIPLNLRSPRSGQLVLALAGWYRAGIALILVLLGTGLALGGGQPRLLSWTILLLVALGGLYQETWSFDADAGQVAHRAGLLFLCRPSVLPFGAIEQFRIIPREGGALPPGAVLVMECAGGAQYLLDHRPARQVGKLRDRGARLAELCARPLVEG